MSQPQMPDPIAPLDIPSDPNEFSPSLDELPGSVCEVLSRSLPTNVSFAEIPNSNRCPISVTFCLSTRQGSQLEVKLLNLYYLSPLICPSDLETLMVRELYEQAAAEEAIVHPSSEWTVSVYINRGKSWKSTRDPLVSREIPKYISRIVADNITVANLRELSRRNDVVNSRSITVEQLMDINPQIYVPDPSSWSKWSEIYSNDPTCSSAAPPPALAGEFYPVENQLDVDAIINEADIFSQEVSRELHTLVDSIVSLVNDTINNVTMMMAPRIRNARVRSSSRANLNAAAIPQLRRCTNAGDINHGGREVPP
ncbi:hypothetical protein GEMRC1_010451 [Eukaryota sp. GEM-RC1]